MSYTQTQLKQIIKEEIQKVLQEAAPTADPGLNSQQFPQTIQLVNNIGNLKKTEGGPHSIFENENDVNTFKKALIKTPGLFFAGVGAGDQVTSPGTKTGFRMGALTNSAIGTVSRLREKGRNDLADIMQNMRGPKDRKVNQQISEQLNDYLKKIKAVYIEEKKKAAGRV